MILDSIPIKKQLYTNVNDKQTILRETIYQNNMSG